MQLQRISDIQNDNITLSSIPIDKISPSPYQSRRKFDTMSIHSLAQSIRSNGLLQPIAVRQISFNSYELIAGERRLRASRIAGMSRISAIIVNASDEQSAILCMIENVQRENLHFFEVAQGYKRLIQVHNMTQEQLARKLGIKQSTIANKIRILRLSQNIKERILKSNLTERHARALLRLPDTDTRQKILDTIISRNLNVKAADELIHSYLLNIQSQSQENRTVKRIYSDWRLLNNSIKSLISKMTEGGSNIKYDVKDLGDSMQMTIVYQKCIDN